MYENGCYYSGLTSTSSALSTVVHIEGNSKLYDHLLISKFIKVIYNQHPTLPGYVSVWGINVLLAYNEFLPANSEMTSKMFDRKLTVLPLILSEQQKQTSLTIDIANVKIYEGNLHHTPKLFKHTKPSRPLQLTVYHKFNGALNFV